MREEDVGQGEESNKVNIRTFKASTEIENLYRFISEFRLRKEAKIIFKKIFSQIQKTKKISEKKKKRIDQRKSINRRRAIWQFQGLR